MTGRRVTLGQLTPAQTRVLALIAQGHTRGETATELHISVETVKSHLKWTRQSLGARNTIHAVVIAHRRGLIDLQERKAA